LVEIGPFMLHAPVGQDLQQGIAAIALDAVVRLFQGEALHP
jgi:hypothetical protein